MLSPFLKSGSGARQDIANPAGGRQGQNPGPDDRSTTVHFTPLKRFTAPTPMIDVEMT